MLPNSSEKLFKNPVEISFFSGSKSLSLPIHLAWVTTPYYHHTHTTEQPSGFFSKAFCTKPKSTFTFSTFYTTTWHADNAARFFPQIYLRRDDSKWWILLPVERKQNCPSTNHREMRAHLLFWNRKARKTHILFSILSPLFF